MANPDLKRSEILRRILTLLTGPEAMSLNAIQDDLEANGFIFEVPEEQRASLQRTLRNYLKHLQKECDRVLGDRCRWIQGSGPDVSPTLGTKGPYYRLALHDAPPVIDAAGNLHDSAEVTALTLAHSMLGIAGGGSFEDALGRIQENTFPDALSVSWVQGQAIDQGTRPEVLRETLRVLSRNATQVQARSQHRRLLQVETRQRKMDLWPLQLHPAWAPPLPSWRLLAWSPNGYQDVNLAEVDAVRAGKMLHENEWGLPPRLEINAACLIDAAFLGSCSGPLKNAEILVGPRQHALARMRWGAKQTESGMQRDSLRVCFETSDPVALRIWCAQIPELSLTIR